MKTATFMGPGQMTITEAPKPTIEKPTDAGRAHYPRVRLWF